MEQIHAKVSDRCQSLVYLHRSSEGYEGILMEEGQQIHAKVSDSCQSLVYLHRSSKGHEMVLIEEDQIYMLR